MLFSDRKIAGLISFVNGVQCLIGINLAEFLYPNYSGSANAISDLGATCRSGTCVIVQPSSIIFTASVAVLGAFGFPGNYFLYRATKKMILPSLLILSSVGALGIAFFPETAGPIHAIFSLIVFLFGGLAAISSFQVEEFPMNYLSILLGVVSLIALGLTVSGTYLGLGAGGMERMIAYPALLWLVGFGANLMKT